MLTAAYLINRLPTRTLNFKTPIQVFTKNFPNSRLITNIPLKIFGCVAFVHNFNPQKSKFDPKAHRCIFVGYPTNQKGYKCFDPISKKLHVSMDVTFHEGTSYYNPSHVQGESQPNEHEIVNSSDFQISLELGHIPVTDIEPDLKVMPETNEKRYGLVYSKKKSYNSQHLQASHLRLDSDPQTQDYGSKIPANTLPDNSGSASQSNLPIALRKGVRTCTQHPLSNFVSYKNISPQHCVFISQYLVCVFLTVLKKL